MSILLRFLLALISGGIAVFAFPPYSFWPLAFVAWPVLFLAIKGAGGRDAFRLGVVHGLMLFGCTLSWFLNIFGPASVALWLILSLFTGLACGLIGWSESRRPAWVWLPLHAAWIWSGVEYFRCEWFWLRFPWMTPGLALGPTWLSPFVGVYGAGFLVILVATFLVYGPGRSKALALILVVGLSVLALNRPGLIQDEGPSVRVLALQSEQTDFESYLQTSKASDFRDGVILWPEYSAPFEIKPSPENGAPPRERAKLADLVRDKRAVLVFGTWKDLPEGKHYNVARTLDESGDLGWHAKNRPVHFMNDGEPGKTAEPVTTRFGKLGTPVCFDCDYTEVIRRMTSNGAEAFTVPIMDAANWTAREHLQHAELFRHRALENGRWFAVAATSGMTQFIDAHGNRVAQLPLMDEGTLQGTIHIRRELTFFTRYGWLFPWCLLVLAVGTTFWLKFKGANLAKPVEAGT